MAVPPVNTSRISSSNYKGQTMATSSGNTRLSVNAQVFTPLTSGFPIITTTGGPVGFAGTSPVRELIIGSSPDTLHSDPPKGLNMDLTLPQNPGVIGTGPSIAARSGMIYNAGIFTTEEQISTRAFLVAGFELKGQEAYRLIGRTYRVMKIFLFAVVALLTLSRTSIP